MPPMPADDTSVASATNVVELATLTIASSFLDHHHQVRHDDDHERPRNDEATLHLHGASAAETSAALIADQAEAGTSVPSATAAIQAVVDLTVLSDLARVKENEFVVGLHREAHDHHYNPRDSFEESESSSSDESALAETMEDELYFRGGERQPLVQKAASSSIAKEASVAEVTMNASAFAEALENAIPIPDTTVDTYDNTTVVEDEGEDRGHVELYHEAFLLELPGDQAGNYVLALPEIEQVERDDDDISAVSSVVFPMLEKAMSYIPTHLPTDIKEVQLEATEVEVDKLTTEIQLDLVVKRQVPFIGYAILIAGFFALSSVGVALKLQGDGVTPTLKTFWRVSATALGLLPLAINSIRTEGLPKLSRSQWIMFPLAAIAYGEMTTAFVVALSMTSLANAFILSNLTSLVLIAGKLAMGVPIVVAEVSGALIGFSGAAICAFDTSEANSSNGDEMADSEMAGSDPHPNEMIGNLIALSASFGMAAYLAIARDLRANCNLYVFMFVIMLLSSIFILLFIIMSGENVSFSFDTNHGVFGWLNLTGDRLALELYMVLSCNFLGTMGYVAVLKYFDSVVVSTVMLMEPVCAALFGFWAGLDPLPGPQTWVGDVVVTLGSAIVIMSGAKKTEHIDATKAMRHRSDTVDNWDSSFRKK